MKYNQNNLEKTAMSKAYEKIFGDVNTTATKRCREGEKGHVKMRVGKTAKDKANGHIPYKRNRRVLDLGAPLMPECNRRRRIFIKV